MPDITEEFADADDGFGLDPFATSLPLAETVQKMKIIKTAAVKFLIILSFLIIFQTMTNQYTSKKRNVNGGKKIASTEAEEQNQTPGKTSFKSE